MALSDEELLRLLAAKFERAARVREEKTALDPFYTAMLVLDSIGAALEQAADDLAALQKGSGNG